MPPVSRAGRIVDTVGLTLFVMGVAVLTRAWFGFRAVEAFEPTTEDGIGAAVLQWERFASMQRIGIAVVVVAICTFTWSWWAERSRPTPRRQPSPSSDDLHPRRRHPASPRTE